MALIAFGVTRCSYCERIIQEGDEVEGFTVFVWDETDPLFRFNDAAFHRRCLQLDPLGTAAQVREAEVRRYLGPGSHVCMFCGEPISDRGDNIAFLHMADEGNELAWLNYVQFHRGCLPKWPNLAKAAKVMREAMANGRLQGDAFRRLLRELEAAERSL